MQSYTIDNLKDFNLDHIFTCGQCFRWEKQPDGSYTGIAFGRRVNMRVESSAYGERLTITPCTEEEFQKIWRPYLDLDRDYGAIKAELSAGDPVMAEAAAHGYGIRILKQDLWETIVSFIISQNNNIPRIKGCIERLCALTGGPDDFPGPETLAQLTVEDLAEVRLGYRAKYLVAAAQKVCAEGLPTNEEEVLALPGVGPKVANCILLFGMGQHDRFPVDVWVRRVMHELYGINEKDTRAMTKYAREHFGNLGGFAQQYLFHYIRNCQ